MKKLLTTLLSVLMLCTIATTNVFAETTYTTVGEIMALAPDFPSSTNQEAPNDAWVNENGEKIYINKAGVSKLQTRVGGVDFSSSVTPDSQNRYKYTGPSCSQNICFNLQDNKLVSIEVEDTSYLAPNATGTYYPSKDTKDVQLKYELASGYEWSVPSNTQTLITEYETIGDVAVTKCVLDVGKVLKITVASKNNFNVKLNDNSIAYTLSLTNGGDALTNNATVVSTNTTKTQTLYGKLTGEGAAAGTYTDTLTFTASVVDAN